MPSFYFNYHELQHRWSKSIVSRSELGPVIYRNNMDVNIKKNDYESQRRMIWYFWNHGLKKPLEDHIGGSYRANIDSLGLIGSGGTELDLNDEDLFTVDDEIWF